MPTEQQVWTAADEIDRSGVGVALARLLPFLRSQSIKCTERTVGPHLLSWKKARNYEPRRTVRDLPDTLKGELAGVVSRLWDAALLEATERLADKQREAQIEATAARELMDEAYAAAEVAEREAAFLRTRVSEADTEVKELRKRVGTLIAEEFWDRVMREIAEVLPGPDWIPDHEVCRLLPNSLARDTRGRPLTRGMLNTKMGVRAYHHKFFELEERGDAKWYRRRTA